MTIHSPGSEQAADTRRTVGLALLLSLVIGVLVTAFVWPSSELAPRDVPVAVVGPDGAVSQLEGQLTAAMPDAFDIQRVADADVARQAIEDRDVYGAVVLEPSGPTVLTAPAASPVVAQLLEAMAGELGEQPSAVEVNTVVPLPDDDPRGSGFSAGALPMVMAGMAVGVGMSVVVTGTWRRINGAVLAATGGSMVSVLVMQTWLGVLAGSWWANAGAMALTIGATALAIIGLRSTFGLAGVGVGTAVMLMLGNPLSGVTSAPEMLPSGWGTLGQLLPPGAGGSLLRSTSFFDGAAAGGHVLVLTCWIAIGLVLTLVGSRLSAARPRVGLGEQRRDVVG